MLEDSFARNEKKVEYVELIYDLIFVYIIGRNNSLLQYLEDGFVSFSTFLTYLTFTLAVIQLWTLTTYYINVYGRNGVRDHVMLFVNMFLLYYMGEATRQHWQAFHTQYHVAWILILINIALQYFLELRNRKGEPEYEKRIIRMAGIILIEALLVFCAILEYRWRSTTYLSLAAILISMVLIALPGKDRESDVVDFTHLSERAMLYVVFTFGEMIIVLAGYFEGHFSFRNLYFSLMGFLIVVGLFLSYGMLYDHIIDREKKTNGIGYMLIHIFIIFSLNSITISLDFMRMEGVSLLPRMIMLTASFVAYFFFLFATEGYAKPTCYDKGRLLVKVGMMGLVFVVLMILLRDHMILNIALSVAFIYCVFFLLYDYSKKVDCRLCAGEGGHLHGDHISGK